MVPLPEVDDSDLVVSYTPGSEEGMHEALVNAFLVADVDVFDRPTQLADWIDPDAVTGLEWAADRSLYLCTRVWGRPVVVTADEVRVYSESTTF